MSMIEMARSVPAMVKRPASYAMSPTPASRRWAAMILPFSTTLALASTIAVPLAHQRLRPAGAAARHEFVGIGLHQPDGLERHAELVDENLREGRGVSLAVVVRPGAERQRAVGIEMQAGEFLGHRRGDFEKLADAATADLAALPRLHAGAPQSRPNRRRAAPVRAGR